MKVNQISFKPSTELFGPDTVPTDVVEIYIDDKNLSDVISCGLPLWPSELYTSLMRNTFLKDEPVNIYVCGCGCVGCGDTEVHIEETNHFVIWYDFIHDLKPIESGSLFVFDRKQYYNEVNKILKWVGEQKSAHYIGNVFTVWSDELRFNLLADNLSESCTLKCDFISKQYQGKEEVLQVLRRNLLEGSYKEKEIRNYFYKIAGHNGEMEERGYNKWYLGLYHHENPYEVVMYITFKSDRTGKINEILLSRNKEWFKPVHWSFQYPLDF